MLPWTGLLGARCSGQALGDPCVRPSALLASLPTRSSLRPVWMFARSGICFHWVSKGIIRVNVYVTDLMMRGDPR